MTVSDAPDTREEVRAITDPKTGEIEASAVFETTLERLFRALTTEEICNWWIRPGVFNTQEWSGDVREGGRWAAAGVGGEQLYQLEGEFVAVDVPNRLTQTWKAVGAPFEPAMLTYELEQRSEDVQLTLRHSGLPNAEVCEKTRVGWETSLARLQEIIAAEKG